jgi:hypothetical protein
MAVITALFQGDFDVIRCLNGRNGRWVDAFQCRELHEYQYKQSPACCGFERKSHYYPEVLNAIPVNLKKVLL